MVKPGKWFSAIWGVLLGFYSGFIGAGSGVFWISVSTKFLNVDLKQATAVANLMTFITNVSALIGFMFLKSVDYKLGVVIAIAGAIGSYLGAHLIMKYGSKFIRPAMLSSLMFMCTFSRFKAWC